MTRQANPLSRSVYQTDFGILALPASVQARSNAMKWRKRKPWCPDRRFIEARAWLVYEKRLRDFAQAEYIAGRNPTHAPEWHIPEGVT